MIPKTEGTVNSEKPPRFIPKIEMKNRERKSFPLFLCLCKNVRENACLAQTGAQKADTRQSKTNFAAKDRASLPLWLLAAKANKKRVPVRKAKHSH